MGDQKYQAWDVATKKMYEVVRLDWESGEVYLRGKNDEYGFAVPWDERIKLRQPTVLKDKNGVEIYEGDIVKIPAYSRDFKTVVEYSDFYVGFKPFTEIGQALYETCEVIGNIYENPDLLEKAA